MNETFTEFTFRSINMQNTQTKRIDCRAPSYTRGSLRQANFINLFIYTATTSVTLLFKQNRCRTN